MARSKEEREALRAELDQEEAAEKESRRGGGRSENIHLDLTEAVRDKILTPKEARALIGFGAGDDDDDGNGDDDGDDGDDGKGGKSGKKKDDDDDGERPPRRRGYFDSGS